MFSAKIGFIGQGFIGRSYADDFEKRGYQVVRYALESEYESNKNLIKECDFVLIAVPTPTTPAGFDGSVIRSVLGLVGEGKVAIIKSTILPGTTEKFQKEFPSIFIMHSPEFLRATSAAADAANPERNIIGIPEDTQEYRDKAQEFLNLLPRARYELITAATNAECIKYIGNCFLHTKVVFMNIAYDWIRAFGGDWEEVAEAVGNDSRIGRSHMKINSEGGRGSGGYCFPKDFEVFLEAYEDKVRDKEGIEVLKSLRDKNNKLLVSSGKDMDILKGIYGEGIIKTQT